MNPPLGAVDHKACFSIAYAAMNRFVHPDRWPHPFSIAYAAMNAHQLVGGAGIPFSIAYAAMNFRQRTDPRMKVFSIAYAAMNHLWPPKSRQIVLLNRLRGDERCNSIAC